MKTKIDDPAQLNFNYSCDECDNLNGRFCLLSANHCIRRAEDCYSNKRKIKTNTKER